MCVWTPYYSQVINSTGYEEIHEQVKEECDWDVTLQRTGKKDLMLGQQYKLGERASELSVIWGRALQAQGRAHAKALRQRWALGFEEPQEDQNAYAARAESDWTKETWEKEHLEWTKGKRKQVR